MKRMMTLLLAAVLTAALWAGTPLPVQAANEFTPDIVCTSTLRLLPLAYPIARTVGLHCGAVDNVPDISDMLRYHRIRYLAIHCKIVDSHSIQIHRSNAVIIGRLKATSTLYYS